MPQPPADRRRAPNWTTGAKQGVGTAASGRSRVWFTIARGVLTEVYYPRIDQANTRDLRLVLSDGAEFVSDEARDAESTLRAVEPGIPAYHVRNRCRAGRYVVEKTVLTDVERAVVLQRTRIVPGEQDGRRLRVNVLLAPHVGDQGLGNDAWVGEYKGRPMLFARRGERSLALACSTAFTRATCSYAGEDDAWADLRAHGELTVQIPHAFDGNLLLAMELAPQGAYDFLLALAFGGTPEEAGQQARASMQEPFDGLLERYVQGWRAYHADCAPLDVGDAPAGSEAALVEDGYRVSAAMLRAHEDKEHAGALIASLAIPWGESHGDHDQGGYHLVWPRDLVESAGGLLACGLHASARQALLYLMSTQEWSGHWPQNMWLDGKAYWHGVQLDETGLPILLAGALRRRGALDGVDPWPMVRRACGYLVRNGPATPEDRWEEEGGYSPFSLAVVICALLVAADFADDAGEPALARYLRETADYWNACIERWTYVTDTDLARRLGVAGYYVRLTPPQAVHEPAGERRRARMALKNHPLEHSDVPYAWLVSPDALALVRFGLRDARDPRMRDTVHAIDAMLETRTATGPVWHRYTMDGYGEHADGSPFDGTGIGRGWPLLVGERAHFEVAAGNVDAARALRQAMLSQASDGGLIPEQVWDAPDIPERGLFNGRPTGSAMPLVWAHAEYVKLCRSIDDGRVFDTPPEAVARYGRRRPESPLVVWRRNNKRRDLPAGKVLRIEMDGRGVVRWRVPGTGASGRVPGTDTGLGISHADLPTADLAEGTIEFELCDERGEPTGGDSYVVHVERPSAVPARHEARHMQRQYKR